MSTQRNEFNGDKSQDHSSKMLFVPQNFIYSFSDLKLLSQFILIHNGILHGILYFSVEMNNLKPNAF